MALHEKAVLLSAWSQTVDYVRANVFLAAFVAFILYLLNVRYNTPLRQIPGPYLASFTRLWKVSTILTTRQEVVMMQLHKRHGNYLSPQVAFRKHQTSDIGVFLGRLVRIGPNEISVADPEALKVIYGASSKFRKTR